MDKPQCKLRNLLCNCSQLDEEFRRLSTALRNLKRYTGKFKKTYINLLIFDDSDRRFFSIDTLLENENGINNTANDVAQLHWDSWDWPEPSLPSSYGTAVPSQDCPTIHFNGNTSSAYTDQTGNNVPSGCSSATPPVLSPPLTPVHKIRQGKNASKYIFQVSSSRSNFLLIYRRICAKIAGIYIRSL